MVEYAQAPETLQALSVNWQIDLVQRVGLGVGDVPAVVPADPTRWAMMWLVDSGTIRIWPDSMKKLTSSTGILLTVGVPFFLNYRDHGNLIQQSWSLNNGVGVGTLQINSMCWRPQ